MDYFFFAICIFQILFLSFADNIEDMIRKMSIQEKIGQLSQIDIQAAINWDTEDDSITVNYDILKELVQTYKVGSIMNSPYSVNSKRPGYSAFEWRQLIYNMHMFTATMPDSKHNIKIPIIYGIDSIHGATFIYKAALYPQQIGIAATFNNTLAHAIGSVMSKDNRAAGKNLHLQYIAVISMITKGHTKYITIKSYVINNLITSYITLLLYYYNFIKSYFTRY